MHFDQSESEKNDMQTRLKRSRRRTFVYAICGDRHVERLNLSMRFLKKFSRSDIVVVATRTSLPIEHEQIVRVPADAALNDHQMGLLLKTNLHHFVGNAGIRSCYLDTDVIATGPELDSIFDTVHAPFAFAPDHVDMPTFSPWAVACGCRTLRCQHLIKAIHDTFGVDVDPKWQHWNGGVFLFSDEAAPLLNCWHDFTRRIIGNTEWQTRDQGPLIAAAWKLGLQGAPTLPKEFNFIVDCFRRMPLADRGSATAQDLPFDDTYTLRKHKNKPRPVLLHFINGGVMRRGWKNWDETERLLGNKSTLQAPAREPVTSTVLTSDNRIVHGLWIGERLSRLELLTIHSFLRHGHEFHLWLYDDLQTPLPKNVILENAEEILPRTRIFRRAELDPETGVGRDSLASFADLFRYKLLFERGGWWVDMDVTCLRPFNFQAEYVFRTHRVGAVNNVIKCPPRSMLMRMTYEQVERQVSQTSPWLLPNRILFDNILRLKLDRFLRSDLCNPEDWLNVIKPLIEKDCTLPKDWYAVHWINEMWRTLQADGGRYKGRRYVNSVPSKDDVPEKGVLGRLYREHGLMNSADPMVPGTSGNSWPQMGTAPVLKPAERQPVGPEVADDLHINILIPSLTLGGAERMVVETLQSLAKRAPTAKLFVMNDAEPGYGLKNIGRTKVFRLHNLGYSAKLRTVAMEVLASTTPIVFTHLIKARHLRVLWTWGVSTIPVVHNSRPAWQDEPTAFDHPRVPFVVAVSESVAEQLRDAGCPKPVVTLRHEVQRWFSIEELKVCRREIRERHAILNDTLLIGMVGEFKSQKAYTRAVRVLAEIRRHYPAKLMILGGWDHDWGNGRVAYAAACRQALELGVMPDFLTPGLVRDTEKYYAAFDVFLNTSVYEGLSVAALEALHAGCPIVSADAGGNREALAETAVIVEDSSDISAYVCAVERALAHGRRPIPVCPADAELVPRLWTLLGQYGSGENSIARTAGAGCLFLTDNLNLGGAARSLVNLLCRLPQSLQPWLGVLNEVNHQVFLDELEQAAVPVFSLRSAGSYIDRVERILSLRRRLGAHTLVFWNLDARVKLLLAKILPSGSVRLIDVSPGPWLFEDLNLNIGMQRRIAFDYTNYFKRLDHFVAKYSGGAPPGIDFASGKLAVIPNGVPDLFSKATRSAKTDLPPGVVPDLVIGTCCRILHCKRLEYLVDMMAEMNRRLSGVSLVVVGAANRRYEKYWKSIIERANSAGVANIRFVGQQADVVPYLRMFRVFVMLGTDHGCPNASLEAMSLGLPIVTARHGGAVEQVEDGVNGFLVSDEDPTEMAHRVRTLLTNPEMRRRFGDASSRIAREKFSVELMVQRYVALFTRGDKASQQLDNLQALRLLSTQNMTEGEQLCIN